MSDEVITTLITSTVTLVLGVLSFLGIRSGVRKRRKRRSAETDAEVEQREGIEKYAADPTAFVKDVLESNRQLSEEVRGLRGEVGDMRRELADTKREHGEFRAATARWVYKIMMFLHGHSLELPYPDGEDAKILREVIPAALEATRPRT